MASNDVVAGAHDKRRCARRDAADVSYLPRVKVGEHAVDRLSRQRVAAARVDVQMALL